MKRSNEPIFWSLFGAGGMLAALVGPALVFITGIAVPLGVLDAGVMGYARMQAFAASWVGKAACFAVVALFLWHAAHRIQLTLHDLGVHAKTGVRVACYGFAFAGSLIAAYVLVRLA